MTRQPTNQEQDASNDKPKCFVVMPFGEKPFNDGSGRTYNFDKVYKILIQKAIFRAGMEPIRADEHERSGLIHSDMFKDLRDQPVVLADLSLDNPNVFYELGIRHVMSHNGTVLICNKETKLPFDVRLSRVVFYEYDGKALDWEEVEDVVPKVQRALESALTGKSDSPVYALLETVLRKQKVLPPYEASFARHNNPAEELVEFQELVATYWMEDQEPFDKLKEEHWDTVFGTRAMGYYCIKQIEDGHIPPEADDIAQHLVDAQQYALANDIFERLKMSLARHNNPAEELVEFQELVATYWMEDQEPFDKLKEEHWDTVFGTRAMGYYCIKQIEDGHIPPEADDIAQHLVDAQQYALANDIFERLKNEKKLTYKYLLRYASSYTEEYGAPHLPESTKLEGANQAIQFAEEALIMVKSQYDPNEANPTLAASGAFGFFYRHRAELQQWKWQLTQHPDDLDEAIRLYQQTLKYLQEARDLGAYMYLGYIAEAHLMLVLLLRQRGTPQKEYLDDIMKLHPRPKDDPYYEREDAPL